MEAASSQASTSPRRPRGPGGPTDPAVVTEAVHGESRTAAAPNSSRSSLFGLFRRQTGGQGGGSRGGGCASLRSVGGRSVGVESVNAAFDNMSFSAAGAGLETPQQARDAGGRAKRMHAAATRYRRAIEGMSEAAAEFGATLYACADTKGAAAGRTPLAEHGVGADLQAAGGLHELISNHAKVLASSLEMQVEGPVQRAADAYTRRLAAREAEFKTQLSAKMRALRQADTHRGDTRKRGLNLLSYRSTLLDLTSQIDDINRLKFEFLSDIHALSTELAEALHASLASAVTAEIEVFESIARKGWSGNGLDGLLAGCPDPFESDRGPAGALAGLSAAGGGGDGTAAGSSAGSASGSAPSSAPGSAPGNAHSSTFGSTLGSTLGGLSSHIRASRQLDDEDGEGDETFDHEDAQLHAPPSSGSSAKSPNFFSIIPPVPILPPESYDDEDDIGLRDDTAGCSPREAKQHAQARNGAAPKDVAVKDAAAKDADPKDATSKDAASKDVVTNGSDTKDAEQDGAQNKTKQKAPEDTQISRDRRDSAQRSAQEDDAAEGAPEGVPEGAEGAEGTQADAHDSSQDSAQDGA